MGGDGRTGRDGGTKGERRDGRGQGSIRAQGKRMRMKGVKESQPCFRPARGDHLRINAESIANST